MMRTPIIAFLGHVDAGKTTLQDFIRKTAIAKSEPGEITQAIGASLVPAHTIQELCGPLLDTLGIKLTIPGLLMIDTPGHAAFVSLRKRGGTLADLAVLVINIQEGLMPQTLEAIEILKRFKTPFIIAANKIDTIGGWQSHEGLLLQNIAQQQKQVQDQLDTLLYRVVGKLAELGFDADRYDRVDDYQHKLAIIPCSAKTGEGMPELLMMAAGLSQRFLGEKLAYSMDAPAKGTVLEVKKEKGLGVTIDVILYDGILKRGDEIVIGGVEKPLFAKIKALFEPNPLSEMRDSKTRYRQVPQAVAATGIKIAAIGLEEATAGMPLTSTKQGREQAASFVQSEIADISITLDEQGVVAKADTLGALEALVTLLRERGIKVKKAVIGEITHKDVSDAATSLETSPLDAAVIGFNVSNPQLTTVGVRILTDTIIYSLIDKLEAWRKEELTRLESNALKKLPKPAKILLLRGYTFRQSNPAIIGAEVLLGKLTSGAQLMKDGVSIASVREIQHQKENVSEAIKGQQVAVALDGVIIGRQIEEGDTLYSFISEQHFRKLRELKQYLSDDEKEALKEIASLMRKDNVLWGV